MPDTTAPLSLLSSAVRQHNRRFLLLGILLALLGGAAIVFPMFTVLAVEILIGWVLVVHGILAITHAWGASHWKGFGLSLLSGLLSIAVGVVLLLYPLTGVLSLTLLIAAFLIAEGILRIVLGIRLRPLDHWGLLLASGVLTVLLGLLILTQWPEAAPGLIGILVGIDLLVAGVVAITLAIAARNRAEDTPAR